MGAKGQLSRSTGDCNRCGSHKIVNRLIGDSKVNKPASRQTVSTRRLDAGKPPASVAREIRKAANACFLVSCVASKRTSNSKARELYISDWFKKARNFVERAERPWWILSAEYGLLHPDTVVAPYEKTLNNLSVAERRAWASRVKEQMSAQLPPVEEIVVFAGARYREFLLDYLETRAKVVVPLEGLTIGRQLSWFGSQS